VLNSNNKKEKQLVNAVPTLNNLKMFATMMETTLKEAPMTAVTGLCGT
jgi:hypothetical protein